MLLAARDVHKSFGGVRALRGADLEVAAGEVHGLAGANGSGKSTLLGIVSGQLQPDAGQVVMGGRPTRFASPRSALAAGVGIVTQETSLVPTLSVTENVLLGHRAVRRPAGIDWRATRRRAREVLDRLGVDVDPGRRVETLAPDQMQMVEIARALAFDTRVLILDEPTSSLTDDRVEGLFAVVRALRAEGLAIVFVSHRTSELLSIADRITVLRDGQTVATAPVREYDARRLLRDMVGEEPSAMAAAPRPAAARRDRPLLSVAALEAPPVSSTSLQVHAGESVGLAGLEGSGRSELLHAVFGLAPRAGEVTIDGIALAPGSPRAAIKHGVAYVTGDRRRTGLLLGLSVRDNMALAVTSRRPRLARRRAADEERDAAELGSRVALAPGTSRARAGTLSGGNQQKVVLGKWLAMSPRLLLLDEPTRGVDIAAKAEIHALLLRARDAGTAIVVSSSESDELLELCDRVLVMARGHVVADLPGADASDAAIAHYTTGHTP